jgi:long-chain acyl-CoA synthetase
MSIVPQNIGKIYDAALDRAFEAAEVHALAEIRAQLLWELGVKTGSRVLISHGNSISFFVDLFACWKIGACAVPVDPTTSWPELKQIGEFIETPLLLHRDPIMKAEQSLNFQVVHTEETPHLTKTKVEFDSALTSFNFQLDDDALILFTSGSTSQPKGVVHTFRSILAKMAIYKRVMPQGEWKKTLCVIPTHFVYGLMSNSLGPLFQGCDLFVYPSFDLEILTKLGSIIDHHEISGFCSVPSMWKIIFEFSSKPQGTNLRRIHCAASPLSRELWLEIKSWSGEIEVKNVYGATEMACAISGPKDGQDFHDGLVGQGWDTRVVVMDENMRPLPPGSVGEVYFQGPSMMKGYFRRPEATSEVIRHGWYRTGDLGKMDTGGDVTLVGRSKYVINKAGMKIYPEDVEALVASNPEVMDVCVFGIDDVVAGNSVAAAVVLRKNASITEIDDWCRQNLTAFKRPSRWFLVSELPRTSRGKINREQLAQQLIKAKPG